MSRPLPTGNCWAPGCERAPKARGYCHMHYRRLVKHGDLNFDRAAMFARGFPDRKARTPRFDLTCECCGATFSTTRSLSSRGGEIKRKFCSRECYAIAKDPKPTFNCEQCGVLVARSKSANSAYNYKQKFCSKSCADAAQRTGCVDKNGYVVTVIDGVAKMDHRRVVERSLGRELSAYETVHHINGIRTDNRLENLELFSTRHGKGQRVSDKIDFAKSILTEYNVCHQTVMSSDVCSGILGFGG